MVDLRGWPWKVGGSAETWDLDWDDFHLIHDIVHPLALSSSMVGMMEIMNDIGIISVQKNIWNFNWDESVSVNLLQLSSEENFHKIENQVISW